MKALLNVSLKLSLLTSILTIASFEIKADSTGADSAGAAGGAGLGVAATAGVVAAPAAAAAVAAASGGTGTVGGTDVGGGTGAVGAGINPTLTNPTSTSTTSSAQVVAAPSSDKSITIAPAYSQNPTAEKNASAVSSSPINKHLNAHGVDVEGSGGNINVQ